MSTKEMGSTEQGEHREGAWRKDVWRKRRMGMGFMVLEIQGKGWWEEHRGRFMWSEMSAGKGCRVKRACRKGTLEGEHRARGVWERDI